MPPSIFRRPPRQVLPPVAAAMRTHDVASFDALVAAITAIQAQSTGAAVASFGSSIRITAPIRVPAPIVVLVPGLRIFADGYVPITADGVVSTLFDVRAERFSVDKLLVDMVDPADGYFGVFVTLTDPAVFARAVAWARITNNHVRACDRLLVDTTSNGAQEGFLVDNNHDGTGIGAGVALADVSINSRRWRVAGNLLPGSGRVGVYVGAQGGSCRIAENELGLGISGGAEIDTSASAGNNAILGNTNVGTISNHVSDEVGLNT